MKHFSLIIALAALTIFMSCSHQIEFPEATNDIESAPIQTSRFAAIDEASMRETVEFQRQIEMRLAEFDMQLALLQAKLENADPGTRYVLRREVFDLQRKRELAGKILDELKYGSADKT